MENAIKQRVLELKDEVIELRRDFHMHPELGFEEFRTNEKIRDYLNKCNIRVNTIAKTGVVGVLETGIPGPTIMLRADMDALSLTEETEVSYKSKYPGKMHACGHDGHIASLLVAAKILSERRESLIGNVKFCFQPNEEADKEEIGADAMIKDGVLKNPDVDICIGLHIIQNFPTGKIVLKEGAFMGGMDVFNLTITGVGGHSAEPHLAIDPITAAAAIVSNVSFIEKREISALDPTIISINTIHGGTAPNVIGEKVEMSGTIRYLYDPADNLEQKPRVRLERLVKSICDVYKTSYTLEVMPSNSCLINDADVIKRLRPVAEKVVGGSNIETFVDMGGDDFAEYLRNVPGAYVFIGCGNEKKGINHPHHHPKFNIDEDALLTSVEFHVRAAMCYLSKDPL